MIRVVNLMFGLQNDGECRRRRRSWYEPDALYPIYNLRKICKPNGRPSDSQFRNEIVNRMAFHPVYKFFPNCKSDGGAIRFTFSFRNVNRMTSHPIYNLEKICKPDGRHPVQFFNLVFELFK